MRNVLLIGGVLIIGTMLVWVMHTQSNRSTHVVDHGGVSQHNQALALTSSAFEPQGTIPSRYTCDGENVNPPIEIQGVPENAASLTLIMDDPDIPTFVKEKYNSEVYDHWVVFNLPADTTELAEATTPPGVQGANSEGTSIYIGSCPPDREHRYFFKLYALDTMLDLPEGSTKQDVEAAMEGHILAEAELIGRYERIVAGE